MFKSFLKLSEPAALLDVDDHDGLEHRRSIRHETRIDATVSCLGSEYACVVRNISTRGMTITADDLPLTVGAQIVARCEFGRVLCGTIRWNRDGAFGVQFGQPLLLDQVEDIRRQVPQGMKPRCGRARLNLPAIVRFADQSRRVEVINLSVGGLSMTSGLGPSVGQSVTIELPGLLSIGGHIRWSRMGRCGVMFSELLTIGVAEELAERGSLPEGWLDEVRIAHATAQAA